ncbi:uncharacterized protein LOC144078086 [Stigmatopora argus]
MLAVSMNLTLARKVPHARLRTQGPPNIHCAAVGKEVLDPGTDPAGRCSSSSPALSTRISKHYLQKNLSVPKVPPRTDWTDGCIFRTGHHGEECKRVQQSAVHTLCRCSSHGQDMI